MWMLVAGVGGALGLASLVGLIWAFRKKKWPVVAGFVVLGLIGGYLVINATGVATWVGIGGPEIEVEPFEAPLDDDF